MKREAGRGGGRGENSWKSPSSAPGAAAARPTAIDRGSDADNDDNDESGGGGGGSTAGLLRSRRELLHLLRETLPLDGGGDNVACAFGYGSGVLAQQPPPPPPLSRPSSSFSSSAVSSGSDDDDATTTASSSSSSSKTKDAAAMIDVILVVRDAVAFHTTNLRRNPSHYAACSMHSPTVGAYIQRHVLPANPWLRNPGLYFHVTDALKYGVVQVDDAADDLTAWSSLYVAGRLHKPVVPILQQDEAFCAAQREHNLPAALSAALLLEWCNSNAQRPLSSADPRATAAGGGNTTTASIGCTTSAADLYMRIAALSYTGDPRVALRAEDPGKIRNLVESAGQLRRFDALYQPAASALQREGILTVTTTATANNNNNTTQWSWDATNPRAHARLWQSLPAAVRARCGGDAAAAKGDGGANLHGAAAAAAQLSAVLASIVAPAARYQSLKGLATAGVRRSAAYAYRKLSKGLLLRPRPSPPPPRS